MVETHELRLLDPTGEMHPLFGVELTDDGVEGFALIPLANDGEREVGYPLPRDGGSTNQELVALHRHEPGNGDDARLGGLGAARPKGEPETVVHHIDLALRDPQQGDDLVAC